jgi:CBS domain-containing protein
MSDAVAVAAIARFGHVVESRTAADIMLPPASVHPSESVTAALRVMHRRRLSGVYVVDAAGRPTGYVDALELAQLAVGDGPTPRSSTAGVPR